MTAAELDAAIATAIEDELRATRPETWIYEHVASLGDLFFRAERWPLLEELLTTAALALLDDRGSATYIRLANHLFDHEPEQAFALVTKVAARRSPARQQADLARVRAELHIHLTR